MTQEEKQLLFKVLCAMLPCGVKINIYDDYSGMMKDEELNVFDLDSTYNIEYKKLRPYLRPMSNMTEEEKERVHHFVESHKYGDCSRSGAISDYLNSIYVDYRGLIEKGLAIKAPEGMYKID